MSIVSLFLIFLTCSIFANTETGLKLFTREEVSKHNNESDCYMIMDKKVYNITSYIDHHPAPRKVLTKLCGQEATNDYNTKGKLEEKHSKKANLEREKYLIGTIKE